MQINFELVSIVNRFKKKSIITNDNHWLWDGARNVKSGHGLVTVKGKSVYLHRYIFCLINDLDYYDKSFLICHKRECNIAYCWNPEHVYKGSYSSNLQDIKSFRTHCDKGHEYTKENTYVYPKTYKRSCLICRRESDKRKYQKRKLKRFNRQFLGLT